MIIFLINLTIAAFKKEMVSLATANFKDSSVLQIHVKILCVCVLHIFSSQESNSVKKFLPCPFVSCVNCRLVKNLAIKYVVSILIAISSVFPRPCLTMVVAHPGRAKIKE